MEIDQEKLLKEIEALQGSHKFCQILSLSNKTQKELNFVREYLELPLKHNEDFPVKNIIEGICESFELNEFIKKFNRFSEQKEMLSAPCYEKKIWDELCRLVGNAQKVSPFIDYDLAFLVINPAFVDIEKLAIACVCLIETQVIKLVDILRAKFSYEGYDFYLFGTHDELRGAVFENTELEETIDRGVQTHHIELLKANHKLSTYGLPEQCEKEEGLRKKALNDFDKYSRHLENYLAGMSDYWKAYGLNSTIKNELSKQANSENFSAKDFQSWYRKVEAFASVFEHKEQVWQIQTMTKKWVAEHCKRYSKELEDCKHGRRQKFEALTEAQKKEFLRWSFFEFNKFKVPSLGRSDFGIIIEPKQENYYAQITAPDLESKIKEEILQFFKSDHADDIRRLFEWEQDLNLSEKKAFQSLIKKDKVLKHFCSAVHKKIWTSPPDYSGQTLPAVGEILKDDERSFKKYLFMRLFPSSSTIGNKLFERFYESSVSKKLDYEHARNVSLDYLTEIRLRNLLSRQGSSKLEDYKTFLISISDSCELITFEKLIIHPEIQSLYKTKLKQWGVEDSYFQGNSYILSSEEFNLYCRWIDSYKKRKDLYEQWLYELNPDELIMLEKFWDIRLANLSPLIKSKVEDYYDNPSNKDQFLFNYGDLSCLDQFHKELLTRDPEFANYLESKELEFINHSRGKLNLPNITAKQYRLMHELCDYCFKEKEASKQSGHQKALVECLNKHDSLDWQVFMESMEANEQTSCT